MRSETRLAPQESRYLALIYRQQIEEGKRITTTTLARFFQVSPATVTEMLQKLAEKRLTKYTRYYGSELTEKGISEAEKLLRKHRILEFLFVDFLRYDAEKACREASKIDYYCSEDLVDDICRAYRHPEVCPCDKEIFKDPACEREDQEREDE